MLLGAGAGSINSKDSAEEAYFSRWEEKHQTRLSEALIKVVGTFFLYSSSSIPRIFARWSVESHL